MAINLINKGYKKEDRPILLEQYRLISESADKITDKRQNTNNFYLAVNSFILAIAGYFANIQLNLMPLFIALIGLCISIVWRINITSFKNLNSAKFKIIHELENYLPANIYKKEDQYLKKNYYNLTSVEKWVPIIFGIIYLIIIAIILINLFF
jgi:hypothetical protein